MKKSELSRTIKNMVRDTASGKIAWDVVCQTTEFNPAELKPVIEEEGERYTVDECYVSYHCMWHGEEFLMITYEMIHTGGGRQKTSNMVFLPPMGVRFFDLHVLMPYAVELDQMLSYEIHTLWMALLEQHRANPELVSIDADERVLTIEED